MDWKSQLAGWTAAQIAETLGCSRVIAYQWLDGSKIPADWQRRAYLDYLQRHGQNRASQETSRRRRAK